MRDVMLRALERMRDLGAEFCDVRFQDSTDLMIRVSDGEVRTLTDARLSGFGLRARIGGSWGYSAIVTEDSGKVLDAAARAVRSARAGTATGRPIPDGKAMTGHHPARVKVHPSDVPVEDKLSMARELDAAQRTSDKVVNTNAAYVEEIKRTAVVNSLGADLDWEDVRLRLVASTVAAEAGRREMYHSFMDGTGGMEVLKKRDLHEMGAAAAKEAVVMLGGIKPPSGRITCITDPVISGLLAHEVMGHASEADEIVKRRSFLTDKVGQAVANEQITMVDDGSVDGAHGSIQFDDEGTPSSRTVIIENGVYRGYMHSLETAAELNAKPTGNARAQDFGRRMWVRMTNTFFEAGDWTLEEIIEDVKFGVITDSMINGMEDPVGGGFEAKALRGFLVENGRITRPVRSLTLTGKALDILRTTDAVGDRVQLDAGMCGKGAEDWVPVASGGPYCRSQIIVGGD